MNFFMKSIFFTAALLIGLSSFAQSNYDDRLLAKFSEDRIQELQKDQPQIIDYYTYYLDHSYEIIDEASSGKNFQTDQEVKIKNLESFNILDLGLTMDRSASKIYRIKGTEKYLRLLSNREFVLGYNKSRNNL
jgi:hypothetical protein